MFVCLRCERALPEHADVCPWCDKAGYVVERITDDYVNEGPFWRPKYVTSEGGAAIPFVIDPESIVG